MGKTKKDLEKELQLLQEERIMETKASIIYQFVVLIAIIILNILVFIKTGQLNDILIGGLLGVLVGLAPSSNTVKSTKDKNE